MDLKVSLVDFIVSIYKKCHYQKISPMIFFLFICHLCLTLSANLRKIGVCVYVFIFFFMCLHFFHQQKCFYFNSSIFLFIKSLSFSVSLSSCTVGLFYPYNQVGKKEWLRHIKTGKPICLFQSSKIICLFVFFCTENILDLQLVKHLFCGNSLKTFLWCLNQFGWKQLWYGEKIETKNKHEYLR